MYSLFLIQFYVSIFFLFFPQNHIRAMLLNDGEGSDFYYMGKMRYNSYSDTTMKDNNGTDVSVVNIQFDMENAVPQNIYNYLEAQNL